MVHRLLNENWVLSSKHGLQSVSRSDFETIQDYFGQHAYELICLAEAEEGNFSPLAKYIREGGFLATEEARNFVHGRLLGLPTKSGQKRTIKKQAEDLFVYGVIRRIQEDNDCTEYRAREFYLDSNPDMNPDTLKSIIARAKETLEHYFGRPPTPPLG